MLQNLLLVGIGGFAGSITRYLFYIGLEQKSGLPFATFAVNMIGSLLLGAFIGYHLKTGTESHSLRLLFAVGFCGSFTTFSTFALENLQLIEQKQFTPLLSYGLGSVFLGIIMVAVGIFLGKTLGS